MSAGLLQLLRGAACGWVWALHGHACLQVRALQEEVVQLKCSVAEGNAEEARSALLQLQRENTEQQRRIKELTAQKVCQVQGDAVPVLGPRKWG